MTADDILRDIAALPDRSAGAMRELRRAWSKRLRGRAAAEIVRIAVALSKRKRDIAAHFIACELLLHHRGAIEALDAKTIETIGEGIDSWVDVDIFGCSVAGPAWRAGRVAERTIAKWARSKDRWWRRTALVATIRHDAAHALPLCEMLVDDRDDMVVKAMSWALRELSKRDRAAAERFLDEHRERLAPRVVRELTRKLETGLKSGASPARRGPNSPASPRRRTSTAKTP